MSLRIIEACRFGVRRVSARVAARCRKKTAAAAAPTAPAASSASPAHGLRNLPAPASRGCPRDRVAPARRSAASHSRSSPRSVQQSRGDPIAPDRSDRRGAHLEIPTPGMKRHRSESRARVHRHRESRAPRWPGGLDPGKRLHCGASASEGSSDRAPESCRRPGDDDDSWMVHAHPPA
jgi:hypothetical protein